MTGVRGGLSLVRLVFIAVPLSCGDGPSAPATRDVTLSFCGRQFVAYQNEGRAWTRVPGSSAPTVTLPLTDRVVFATWGGAADPYGFDLFYITAGEAADVMGCGGSSQESRSLTGSLSGMTAEHQGRLTVGRAVHPLEAGSSPFTMSAPTGTHDLVATRFGAATPTGRPLERVIVRRGMAHAEGIIAPLDFEAPEAVSAQENTLTWTGPIALLIHEFFGRDGNFHPLNTTTVNPSSQPGAVALTLRSVPATLLAEEDVHVLRFVSGLMTVAVHSHAASDVSLSFGPSIGDPTFTRVATSPTLRVRIELPPEDAYDGMAFLRLYQEQSSSGAAVRVTVTTTPGHVGPGTVSLTIPELTGVDGFPPSAALRPGELIPWRLTRTNWPREYVAGPALPYGTYRSADRVGAF